MELRRDFYSVKDLAGLLSVSPWSVRTWLRFGRLRAIKCGARVLIPRESIEVFLQPREVRSGTARPEAR